MCMANLSQDQKSQSEKQIKILRQLGLSDDEARI